MKRNNRFSSSQATPQHEGRYNVTASVGSCTTSAYVDVLVQAPCVAGVTATPQVSCDSSGTATVTFTTSAAAPSGYRFQYKTVLVQQDSLSGQWVDATESNWQSSNVFAQVPDGRYKVKLRTRIDNQNDLFQPHHISEVCATSSEFDVACTQFTCDYYIKAVNASGQEVSKLTRVAGSNSLYQTVTLSAAFFQAAPANLSYSWTGPGITTPITSSQLSAHQIGEYKLTLTQGTTTCEAYINLSGTPCSPIASAPCGSVPTIDIVGGSTEAGPYLTGLAVGDEFTAADYTVTVTSLYSAGGDIYSGEGYVTVKLVGGTSVDIKVEFADIKINDCYQLVVGTVKSMYDPSWSNVVDVDEAFAVIKDILIELEDLYKVYSGTQEEKDKIRQRNTDACAQIENNSKLSPTEKNTLREQCAAYQQKSESFLNCPNPDLKPKSSSAENAPSTPSNARLAVSNTESCKLSDMIDATTEFNTFTTLLESSKNNGESPIAPEQESLPQGTLKLATNFLVPASTNTPPIVFNLPPNSSILYPFIDAIDKNNGALMAFKTTDNKTIIADTRSSGGFIGYSEVIEGKWANKFVPTPITERPIQFVHITYFPVSEGCKVEGYKAVLKEDYSINISADKVFDLVVDASKCSNQIETYANALKTWMDESNLDGDVYLADCDNNRYYHITRNTATLLTGSAPSLTDVSTFTTSFAIKACWDGKKWTQIEHKFKLGALNPTHPKLQGQAAQIELLSNQRIEEKLKKEYPNKNSTGKASKKGTIDADGFRFDQLDMFEMIITVKNVTKDLCNNAKVPEQFYDPASPSYTPSPINVPAFAGGAGDGVLEELTGGLQFISFGLDLATEPAKAKQMYAKIKAVKLADLVKMAQNSISERINIYNQGGIKAQHQGGKDAFAMAQLFFGPYRAMTKADDLIGATAENATGRAAKTLDDLPQMRELDYFSDKTKRGILKDIEDPEVKAFILQNPDIIRGFYKYKTEWNSLTDLEKADMEEAYGKLKDMGNSGEISSGAYNKIDGWYERARKTSDDPEYQVVRNKHRSIAHEKKVTEMYESIKDANGKPKYAKVLSQRYVKFTYQGEPYESVVDNILIETFPDGKPKYIWSDAKLGEGDFTSIQQKLIDHIEKGGDVSFKNKEGVTDGPFKFSEMNEVRSATETVSGVPRKFWPK